MKNEFKSATFFYQNSEELAIRINHYVNKMSDEGYEYKGYTIVNQKNVENMTKIEIIFHFCQKEKRDL